MMLVQVKKTLQFCDSMEHTRTCVSLTSSQKKDICLHKQANSDITNRALARWAEERFKVKVSEPTVSRILKNKEKFMTGTFGDSAKRAKQSRVPEVEEALYTWYLHVQEQNMALSDDMIVAKAKVFYEQLLNANIIESEKTCAFSHGWLEGFKKRHGIKSKAKQLKEITQNKTDEEIPVQNNLAIEISAPPVSFDAVQKSLEILRLYLTQQEQDTVHLSRELTRVRNLIQTCHTHLSNLQQSAFSRFFSTS